MSADHAFSPSRFKIAVGLFTGGLALATLIGPFIGGALVEYVSCRAILTDLSATGR